MFGETDNILSVSRTEIDGKIISKSVDYVIRIISVDINGQKEVKTVFLLCGVDGGILSEAICGSNAVDKKYCKSVKKIEKYFEDYLHIPKNSFAVQRIEHI